MAGGLGGERVSSCAEICHDGLPRTVHILWVCHVSQNVALMLSAGVLWIAQSAQTEYDYSLNAL
ncbi:hypothetical protein BD769DRAFT_1498715, partial [Suillus cothurnatus]